MSFSNSKASVLLLISWYLYVAGVCDAGDAGDVVLPEGLVKEVSDQMRKDGGGGGLLGDVSKDIEFHSEFESLSRALIRIQFWGDGNRIAEVDYYPAYFMYRLKVEGLKGEGCAYSSYTPKWLYAPSVNARDSEGEKLLQPELPVGILTDVQSRLRASAEGDIVDWSYSARKVSAVISVYKMATPKYPNLKGVAEYFPKLGIYRWTFGQPGPGCSWKYQRWSGTKGSEKGSGKSN